VCREDQQRLAHFLHASDEPSDYLDRQLIDDQMRYQRGQSQRGAV
jgi:hypothetical protein